MELENARKADKSILFQNVLASNNLENEFEQLFTNQILNNPNFPIKKTKYHMITWVRQWIIEI
jgi:hypothetical protein